MIALMATVLKLLGRLTEVSRPAQSNLRPPGSNRRLQRTVRRELDDQPPLPNVVVPDTMPSLARAALSIVYPA